MLVSGTLETGRAPFVDQVSIFWHVSAISIPHVKSNGKSNHPLFFLGAVDVYAICKRTDIPKVNITWK